MTSSGQILNLKKSNETYIFGKQMQELSENTIFIYFGQVFQTLWQYRCNLTTF